MATDNDQVLSMVASHVPWPEAIFYGEDTVIAFHVRRNSGRGCYGRGAVAMQTNCGERSTLHGESNKHVVEMFSFGKRALTFDWKMLAKRRGRT